MKFLLLVLFTLASCTKERYEDAATLTDELLHELEKRLNTLDKGYALSEELSGDAREFRKTENKIIKTSESMKAGAIYLGSPELTTEQLCKKECLTNWTCNLAVFKEKAGETSCYLFNCQKPSVCSFVEHDGFSISELPERDTIRKGVSSEDDLEILAALKPKTTTVTSTTPTPQPTTTVTTTTVQTDPPRRQPLPLFSECKDHKDCAGSSTQCLAGYCVCQESYHAQEGLCRPDCTKFQFECSNEGQPLSSPQCIAIYDKCDDIRHCHDGSDEKMCVKDTSPGSPQVQVPGNTDEQDSGKFGHESSGFMNRKPVPPTESHEKADRNDESTERPHVDQNIHGEMTNSKEELPSIGNEGHSEQEQSVVEQKSDESEGEPIPSDKDTGSSFEAEVTDKVTVAAPSTVKLPVEADGNDARGERPNETIEVIEVEENGSLVGVAVDETMVGETDVAVVVQSNTGAVVALSLGLAITFLLLFFVGCRLRNVRKRLRRGRPMNTNEADYLINGMYL